MRSIFFSLILALFILLLTTNLAHAGSSPFTFSQPPNFSIHSIGTFVTSLARLLLIIGSILVFVFIIWGGFQWITSGGDSAGAKEARDKITAAVIGLAILALALALSLLIQYFFGITIIGNQITPKGF